MITGIRGDDAQIVMSGNPSALLALWLTQSTEHLLHGAEISFLTWGWHDINKLSVNSGMMCISSAISSSTPRTNARIHTQWSDTRRRRRGCWACWRRGWKGVISSSIAATPLPTWPFSRGSTAPRIFIMAVRSWSSAASPSAWHTWSDARRDRKPRKAWQFANWIELEILGCYPGVQCPV